MILGREPVSAGASRPLCLTVYQYDPAAYGEDVTKDTGDDGEVDDRSVPVGDSLDGSNRVPDTPRLTPFLDFNDEGAEVNGSDFGSLDFLKDPVFEVVSEFTLEASGHGSEYSDVDVEMSMSLTTVMNMADDQDPQPLPQVLNRTVPTSKQSTRRVPPQFGLTIPELLVRDDIPPPFRMWAMESSEAVLFGDQPLPSAQFAKRFPAVFFPPFLHDSYPDTYFASSESFPARYQSTYTSAAQQRMKTLDVILESRKLSEKRRKCLFTSNGVSVENDERITRRISDEPTRGNLRVASTSGLLRAIHDGNRWYGKFIPTAVQFLGTRSKSSWRFCPHDLQTLQDIWTAVYGKTLPWKIEVNDCIYVSTMDAVHNWHDCISNAALCAFECFFQSERFIDFAARFQFCQVILRDSRLFYESFDTPYRQGLFHSLFVRAALAQHMTWIRGAIHVPSIYSHNPAKSPYGAIGLSAAAVYRAASLFRSTQIRYMNNKTVCMSKRRGYSGWESHIMFSEVNYNAKVKQYAIAASRLAAHEVDHIVQAASLY